MRRGKRLLCGALALVLVSLATYKKAPTPFLDPYAKQKAEQTG